MIELELRGSSLAASFRWNSTVQQIPRHEIPDENDVAEAFRQFREIVDAKIERLQQSTRGISLSINHMLHVARTGSVADPASPSVVWALRLAAEASAAMFADASESRLPPELGGIRIAEVLRSDESLMNASEWLQAFYLNSLCRNDGGVDILVKVPLDVLRASSTKSPEFRYVLVEAIQGLAAGRQDTFTRIIRAMELTDPEQFDVGNDEWVLHFDTHQINLIGLMISGDEGFEAALAHALELHKTYWSKNEERRRSWDGYLSIPLLGIAALAYEKGLHFEIDSEYLPMNLVRSDAWDDSP